MREDLDTEYKSIWDDKWLRNVAAFANTEGGVIYVGVDDKGNVIGLDNIDELLKKLPDKIESNLEICPIVKSHTKNGLDYLTITVFPSPITVLYGNKLYVKSGSTTREVPRADFGRYFSSDPKIVWSNQPMNDLDFDDIDTYAFKEFKKRAKQFNELTDVELNMHIGDLLNKLHLVSQGHPTRAAALLFRDEPNLLSEAAQTYICKMNGSEVVFSDELTSPLYLQVDQIIDLIKTKYTMSPKSYAGIANIETSPYPFDAVREAVLNAIANTDYSIDVPIKIMIYDDHLEILNYGGLPYGSDLETIIRAHISRPRNIGIAAVFKKAQYIEKYGRGFQKMSESYSGSGVEPPIFDASEVFMHIVFKNIVYAKDIVARGFNGEPLENIYLKNISSVDTAVAPIIMTKTQERIIELIEADPYTSAAIMADAIGVSESTVRRALSKLINVGIVRRAGSKRTGGWFVSR